MKENVDIVTILSVRELTPVNMANVTADWLTIFCNPDTGVSYRGTWANAASVISKFIGSGVLKNDRTYIVGRNKAGWHDPVAGTTTVKDAQLDGEIFSLELRGVGFLEKGVEWDNDVVGGGWRLLAATFYTDELYTVHFHPRISDIVSTPDATARMYAGVYPVNADTLLTPASFRRLIYLTGGFTITLNSSYPEGVLLCIAANGLTNKQARVKAPVGQLIMFNGIGYTERYLGKGERIRLLRDGNNWIVEDISDGWSKVGQMVAGRIPGPNQVQANGQEYLQADYPRVVEWLTNLETTFPGSVLPRSQWFDNPLKWCRDDVAGTFIVPQLGGHSLRWADMGNDIDPGRLPGTKQEAQVGQVSFSIEVPRGDSYNGNPYDSSRTGRGQDSNARPPITIPVTVNAGKENRVLNAAELPLIYF